jgi:hypothetical protein
MALTPRSDIDLEPILAYRRGELLNGCALPSRERHIRFPLEHFENLVIDPLRNYLKEWSLKRSGTLIYVNTMRVCCDNQKEQNKYETCDQQ